MTVPLMVLAALSVAGAFLTLPFTSPNLEFLTTWLDPSLDGAGHIEATSFSTGLALSVAAVAIGGAGIALGRALYRRGLPDDLVDPMEPRLGGFAKVLENAYYFDAGVSRVVSGPVTWLASFLSEGVDRKVIDGAVNGTGRVFQELGGGVRRAQTGRVRNYALAILLGAVLLLGWFATRVAF
jgi:NADH-quinone oxidoreductase subunit L